jgi:two-component system, NarL family, sensor histidine kinase LiaS
MPLLARLQWKLTLSYTLVTVAAMLVLELVVMAVLGFLVFRSGSYLPMLLADTLVRAAPEVRTALTESGQERAEAARWIDEMKRRGLWRFGGSGLEVLADLNDPNETLLLIINPAGIVLAASQDALPSISDGRFSPHARDLLRAALAGEVNITRLGSREPDGSLIAAAPVLDDTGRVRGALLMRVALSADQEQSLLASYGPIVVGFVLPSVLVLTLVAGLAGTFFGALVARGLTRRLAAIAVAADGWQHGDFSAFVQDRTNDELGQLAARLNQMALQLQSLLDHREALAAVEERNRLARDLHDSAKQQAFALAAQLAAARALIRRDMQAAEQRLAEAEQLSDHLRQELSHLILELRPPALADRGLPAALSDYVTQWSRHAEILAALHVQGQRAAPIETEHMLFRIAQEALANVARHSHAQQVTLVLSYEANSLVLSIEDDGVGFVLPPSSGIGLHSMRERVAALNGTLVIDSLPGRGTRLVAVVPDTTRSML